MSYRSYYFAVKDVIDGDLCEQYSQVRQSCLLSCVHVLALQA